MIENTPPICEEYQNVIATPTVVKFPPDGAISGCLYDANGNKISLSQRFGGFYGDYFPSIDPEKIEFTDFSTLPHIKENCIYLGHFMPHYGHFLLEMLSSFWTFESFHNYDYFIFHPFVFGEEFTSYIKIAFNTFDISFEKVFLIKNKIIIENITIPERLVKLNKSAKPEVRKVYEFLIQDFTSKNQNTLYNNYNLYYFSRIRTSIKAGERAVINEPFIEKALNRIGFETIYPELLSFQEQIKLINSASVICGLPGSALHNCVFMKPGSILIEIADARSPGASHPMQQICNKLSRSISYFIPFDGIILNKKKWISVINSKNIKLKIAEILDRHKLNKQLSLNNKRRYKEQFKLYGMYCFMIIKNILRLIKWGVLSQDF